MSSGEGEKGTGKNLLIGLWVGIVKYWTRVGMADIFVEIVHSVKFAVRWKRGDI